MRKTKRQILEGVNLENIAKSKIVANNTLQVNYKNGDIAVRLHNTNIFTIKNNGNLVLNSGGWRTPTTKNRININAYTCNIYLTQKNFVWYVNTPKGKFVFYDNIEFDSKGNLITENRQANIKGINKLKKDITKYISLIDKLEKLPYPENGDCWHCFFQDKATGKTMGDISKSDHLQQHIKEGYIFGSILVNAMREYGYSDMKIPFHYQIDNRDTFKRALRKYLYKRLIK